MRVTVTSESLTRAEDPIRFGDFPTMQLLFGLRDLSIQIVDMRLHPSGLGLVKFAKLERGELIGDELYALFSQRQWSQRGLKFV